MLHVHSALMIKVSIYFVDALSVDAHHQARKKLKVSGKWLDGSCLSGSQWASNQAAATGQESQEIWADNSDNNSNRTGSCRWAVQFMSLGAQELNPSNCDIFYPAPCCHQAVFEQSIHQ